MSLVLTKGEALEVLDRKVIANANICEILVSLQLEELEAKLRRQLNHLKLRKNIRLKDPKVFLLRPDLDPVIVIRAERRRSKDILGEVVIRANGATYFFLGSYVQSFDPEPRWRSRQPAVCMVEQVVNAVRADDPLNERMLNAISTFDVSAAVGALAVASLYTLHPRVGMREQIRRREGGVRDM